MHSGARARADAERDLDDDDGDDDFSSMYDIGKWWRNPGRSIRKFLEHYVGTEARGGSGNASRPAARAVILPIRDGAVTDSVFLFPPQQEVPPDDKTLIHILCTTDIICSFLTIVFWIVKSYTKQARSPLLAHSSGITA